MQQESRARIALALVIGALAIPSHASFAANDTGLRLTNTDGTNTAFVRVGNHPQFNLQTFTLEAWVQRIGVGYGFSDDPSGASIISKPQENASGSNISSWHLHWTPQGQIHFNLVHTPQTSGVYVLSSAVSPLGTHHLAVTFDGGTISLYIDGVLSGSAGWNLGSVYYSTEDVLIGADNFNFGYYRRFDGRIDDVRVWDYARTQAQISQGMNCRLAGNEPGLVAYWPFDDSNLIDATGHAHNGIANGNPTSLSYGPFVALNTCTADVGGDAFATDFDLRCAANPSAGLVRLVLAIPRATDARVVLYDVTGREVRVLTEGWRNAGEHALTWDGRLEDGAPAASGMYFATARSDGRTVMKRFAFMR